MAIHFCVDAIQTASLTIYMTRNVQDKCKYVALGVELGTFK